VYLSDTEKKLNVFTPLLARLEIFTHILNKQMFTFKSIKIDKDKGFIFLTHTGKDLNLNDLSSGEQHEIVLLYELLFKTEKNTLVLIDEPEISLHITWQKEFINDLLRIIKLQQIQVIMATHSPQIIHDRWDLAYNLETHID
jgi:predicted ATP-binding protein involved in virulence